MGWISNVLSDWIKPKESLDLTHKVFSNGLGLISQVMKNKLGSGEIGLFFGTGSTAEQLQKMPSGTAHLLEHVLVAGIDPQDLRDFQIGGVTTKNYIGIIGRAQKQNQAKLATVLLECLNPARITEQSIGKEKVRVEQEVLNTESDLSTYFEHLLGLVYKDTSLATPILGTAADRQAINRTHLLSFLNSITSPTNVFLVARGDVQPQALMQLIQRLPKPKPLSTPVISSKTLTNSSTPTSQSADLSFSSTSVSIPSAQLSSGCLVGFRAPACTTSQSYYTFLLIKSILMQYLQARQQTAQVVFMNFKEGAFLGCFVSPALKIPLTKAAIKEIVLSQYQSHIKDLITQIPDNGLLLDLPTLFWTIASNRVPPTAQSLVKALQNITAKDLITAINTLSDPTTLV
ncbi:hypothetical protein NEHOM01_1073 [Nematocida homosporus]|uniref:uncharacterized protein n=1 Tax=Nematocida homosporus TaxID=1912981 RepID=UPI00222067B5|nr:uncharacterized protein NEHOM01_1073 [Nematocida homosporus]KAI5185796.1 hypothetical protein NEHOM01_1073 [Nematocida homosporus]